jgi:hypothetical protein
LAHGSYGDEEVILMSGSDLDHGSNSVFDPALLLRIDQQRFREPVKSCDIPSCKQKARSNSPQCYHHCDPEWPIEDIDPEVIESYHHGIVEYSGSETGREQLTGGLLVTLPFRDVFNLSSVTNVITTIIMIHACCATVALAIWMCIKLTKSGTCKRKKDEIAIVQRTPAAGQPYQATEVL